MQNAVIQLVTDLRNDAEDVSPVAPSPVVETKYITKNIEDIRIGERTLGTNPQGIESSEADSEIFKKVKHHGYTLLYLKENQTLSVIELLRPENWLDTEYVQVRRASDEKVLTEAELDKLKPDQDFDDEDYAFEVWIELPEMGVLGWAALVAIDEEVTIKDGPGNVVTGTFAHVSDNVMDLQLEGQDKPIGCTSNHPFWSVNRQDFVEAGQLMEGEQVQLYNGETKRVVQKLPRPGPEIVYNLEVYVEHVYHVTQDGILVHNMCAMKKSNHAYKRQAEGRRVGTAFKDIMKANDKKVYIQDDGAFFVVGKHGRAHVITSDGILVTTLEETSKRNINHRIKNYRMRLATQEQIDKLKDILRRPE